LSELQSEMKRVKSRVDSLILEEILPASHSVPEVDLLYRMMRDYPSRPAKGMRPFLCVTACEAAGGTEEAALLTAACIELFQNWILIHDDIEDGSELRRGEAALHRKYPEALALNAGDALHARMWGALVSNEKTLGAKKALDVMREFSRMVNETTEGQHMELSWVQHKRWDLQESDYFEMCKKKTSWYTVTGPCRLGAMVAGAGEGVLGGLLEFGTKLGVAFQIQDDALNLVGDEKKYGKARSDDILEGKRTLILLHLISKVEPREHEVIKRVMNKEREDKTPEDLSDILSLIEKYDAVGYARTQAQELMSQAIDVLRRIEWGGDMKAVDKLEHFAKFAVEREW
jgi:geranylgeranyl diphosphate synthase, type II